MNLDEKIQFFFKKPEEQPVIPGRNSTLYLLRRDVSMCFGIYPTKEGGIKILGAGAIWPGVMAILAGIDLLGKFYAGDDSIGGKDKNKGVGPRFRAFVGKYITHDQNDVEILYQLRNSLLHSFGLYSKTIHGEFRFVLTSLNQEFIKNTGIDNRYVIDPLTLWKNFEKGVEIYLKELLESHDLKSNFDLMFDNYGKIQVG